MMINLLSLFSSLNFKKRIINPNFNEHEKSIIHESSKKSKSKTKNPSISHNFAHISSFLSNFLINRKTICSSFFSFSDIIIQKSIANWPLFCYFERGADTRSGAIREHHLARFLLWAGQRNRKTTVSNRCR